MGSSSFFKYQLAKNAYKEKINLHSNRYNSQFEAAVERSRACCHIPLSGMFENKVCLSHQLGKPEAETLGQSMPCIGNALRRCRWCDHLGTQVQRQPTHRMQSYWSSCWILQPLRAMGGQPFLEQGQKDTRASGPCGERWSQQHT